MNHPAGKTVAGPGGTGAAVNAISGGEIHAVVQAGTVSGGVHFHLSDSVAWPTPHQLPPPPPFFVNRTQALEAMRSLCEDRANLPVGTLAIHGRPGIGKTALAIVALQRLNERFPDGELYADLRGATGLGSVPPADVLRRWLRAYRLGPDLPGDLDEVAAMWRSHTAGRRITVLVDNAASADQVLPLLPGGTGSLVVVTSHRPLDDLVRYGARLHELGPLPDEDARRLLDHYTHQLGHDPAATTRLTELAAGSPLALSVAAGVPGAGDTPRTLPRPTASTPQERAEIAVDIALDVSYTRLPKDAALLYGRLGALPLLEFDAALVAVVCAMKEAQAAELLNTLRERSLLEVVSLGRFTFHDEVRKHARQRGHQQPQAAREEALRRLVDWCLAMSTAAEEVLTPSHRTLDRDYVHPPTLPARPFADDAAALAWLEDHSEILMAVVRAAADAGWHAACWQLVDAMWPLFLRLRPAQMWIDAHEIGLAAARAAGDRIGERRMLTSGGVGLRNAGRHNNARTWYQRALTLAREDGHTRDEAQAISGLGNCAMASGDWDAAEKHFTRCLSLRKSIDYPRGEALSHLRLGQIALEREQYRQAIDHLRQAHTGLVAVQDHYDAARAQALLGQVVALSSNAQAGESLLHQALTAFEAAGSRHWQGRTLELLGQIAQDRGNRGEARQRYERSLAIYQQVSPRDAARLEVLLGEVDT